MASKSDDKGNPKVFERKDGTWASSYELTLKQMEVLSPHNGNGEAGSSDSQESAGQPQADSELPW